MNASQYQKELYLFLAERFSLEMVKNEWSIRLDSDDIFADLTSYAPRLDLALGPFNLTKEDDVENSTQILLQADHDFIQRIIQNISDQSEGIFIPNTHPRCLLAIELEWSSSSKHILGGYTNASMMGYIGVLVGPREKIHKIKRIAQYARKLKSVGKASLDLFGNVAVFESDEFIELLNDAGFNKV